MVFGFPIKLIDIARPILCFYNLMLCVFAFLMMVYEISYLDKCKCSPRKITSTSKLFLILVMVHQSMRLTFNFIPLAFYKMLYKSGSWGLAAQNILDLTPEALYILTYTVILLSWIEFFFYLFLVVRQKKISTSSGCVNLPFIGVIALGCFMMAIILAESVVIGIFPALCKDYYTLARIQGITLSATSVTFSASFFFLYFILIIAFCPMRKVWGKIFANETAALRRTLLVITITAFLYFIFLIIRVVWILILNDLLKGWVKSNFIDEWIFHVAWILYMCTEEIPMTLMLVISYIFRTILGPLRLHWKKALKIFCFRTPCCSPCYTCIWGSKYKALVKQPEFVITDSTASVEDGENEFFEAHTKEDGTNGGALDGKLPEEIEKEMLESSNLDSKEEWMQDLYLNMEIMQADAILEKEKREEKMKKKK